MSRSIPPKTWLPALVGIAIVGAGVTIWLTAGLGTSSAASPSPSTSSTATPSQPPVTSTPTPTTAPPAPSAAPAPSLAAPTATDPGAPAAPTARTDVTVAFLGWVPASSAVEATAYAAVIEADATCTLSLERNGTTVSSTPSPAFADAASTSCGTVTIPGSDLVAGQWAATVEYHSSTTSGTSKPLDVEVRP